MRENTNIFKPYDGFQDQFVRSDVDFVIGGGCMSSGKTAAAVMSIAEPIQDGLFRGIENTRRQTLPCEYTTQHLLVQVHR